MVKEEKRNIFLSLVKTRDFLSGGIQNIISSGDHIDVGVFEEIEDQLIKKTRAA